MATAATTTAKAIKGGSFLIEDRTPEDIFIPEEFTDEQRQIGQMTEDFLTNEVLPNIEKMEHGDRALPDGRRRARSLRRRGAGQGFLHHHR